MKTLIPILKQIIESSIDFPSDGLYDKVWEEKDGEYKLLPEVKERILDALSQYADLDLLGIAKEIHIVGSLGTNLYNDDADLDIHIVPDMDKLPTKDIDELAEIQKQVMDWFKNNRDEKDWYIDQHPFEVYLQLDQNQDYSSNCYNLLNDEWITNPNIFPNDYNPYELFAQVFDELKKLCEPFDIQLGELRRDTIDYNRLMDAIKKAPKEAKEGLQKTLEQKLQELEEDIEQLVQNREVWRNVRRRNTLTTEGIVQDIKELQQSPEWQNDNAIFKFLDRYEMMNILKGLKDIIDDGEVTEDEVPEIKDLIKQFGEI